MENTEFKNILSLAAIAKNEALYITEWIEFHRIVGVTHFYIYDNNSTDNLHEKLLPYIEQGIVTYNFWDKPWKEHSHSAQLDAYNHCLANYKNDSKYIGFLDIDEFLMPVKEENLVDVIDNIFNSYEYVGALAVNWRVYGSSYNSTRVDGLVIENYKLRAEDRWSDNVFIKSICNPRVSLSFEKYSHCAKFVPPYHCINENGILVPRLTCSAYTCNKIRINHYLYKSKEEFILRKSLKIPSLKEREKLFSRDSNCNKIYDPIVDKYIYELRKRCNIKTSKPLIVTYSSHIQTNGWQSFKVNGQTSGTEGQSKRLEAIKIQLANYPSAAIKYSVYLNGSGWQEWKCNGEIAGTTGKSKRIEAIRIITEDLPEGLEIQYRVHIQNIGWEKKWHNNGETAGFEGRGLRIEAIQIRIVKKS